MYALQAIETKYHGPTNTRGSRHSARAQARRVMVSCPPELGIVESHAYAARKLAEKMGWMGQWHIGGTKAGYVFVLIPERVTGNSGTLAFILEEAADSILEEKE